ncbi:glycoside hydrolase family 25 protein [Kitasatospora sp. NPDC004669]|uniref:glycoside hydrolase family 25 protein n=1 Tax=Kitasatospora sp. NPDC004669 TaxID=3154555 RepID=UPI0033A20112
MGIYGQDWASYQDSQPDTSGLSFVFTKVTEGTGYINPRWVAQRDHAKANGLVWGGYHYPHMANSPQAEADYFLSQVAWQPGDLIVLDWEGYDQANQNVSRADQAAYKEAWLRYVKQRMPNTPVGMYCNTDYWRNVDKTSYAGDFLWIATAGRAAGDPGIQANWLFHQYSDQPVDSDYCHHGSVDELRAWASSFASPSTPTPQTPEADMPLNDADKQMITDIVRNTVRSGPPSDRDAYAVANFFAYALAGQVPPGGDSGVAQMAGWLHQTTQTCMGAVVDDRLTAFNLEQKIADAVAAAVGPAVAKALSAGIQLTVTPKGN